MRHLRFAWPTFLAAMGCTTFTFALIWSQTATAADIVQISPTHSCSRETDDTVFFAYNNDYECGNNQECRDGDYYYQQKYVFPEDLYGSSVMPSTNIFEVEEMMLEQPLGDINQYMDDQYTGSPYIVDYPPGFETDESLALFTWDPAELLTWSDQEILRVLATVGGLSSGVRRAVISDYIESLGMEATDLSIRFEEISGLVVPALSDDLAQTAAFMACFRLLKRGELESDEALALLQKSLLHRSQRWNCWIDEVTREDEFTVEEEPSGEESHDSRENSVDRGSRATSNPMLKAVVLTAAATLERLGGAISGISHQIKNLY